MLRRLLVKYGWVNAEIAFLGIDPLEITSFVYSLKASQYVSHKFAEMLVPRMQFPFDGVSLMASIPDGNRGARLGILENFDGIAFFMDHSDDETIQYSKEELDGIITYRFANDSELISEFGLENVLKKGKGRVSIFAYTLSPTRFIGCLEAAHWLLDRI